ncbi:hypothetical protein [Motilimonas eburnea]|uniref:hypothetical protein n=1 Tax=Motilimonas eburnea TaxID=1737488 RepID=UPI001E552EA3|nr:hypothetical protein [Motilimonas eburnea]MCE2570433.1 hypothetical protein [Motilimonas eburnea]
MSLYHSSHREYANTAYHGQGPNPAPAANDSFFKSVITKAKLPWGDITWLNPTKYQFKKVAEPGKLSHDASIDHQTYRIETGPDCSGSVLMGFIRSIFLIGSFPLAWGYLFVLFITSIATFLAGDIVFTIKLLFYPFVIFLIFTVMRVLLGTSSPSCRPYIWSKIGLHRCTGNMTTHFGTLPFTDFDAVINAIVQQNGTHEFRLALRYKYPDKLGRRTHDIDVLMAGASMHEAVAAWDMVQRYMDVTKPLPDIPELEPYRHLDPTTLAWDEAGYRGRERFYWRDLYAKAAQIDQQDPTRFIQYLFSFEGRSKRNPLPKMEEEYQLMVWGQRPVSAPWVPAHILAEMEQMVLAQRVSNVCTSEVE